METHNQMIQRERLELGISILKECGLDNSSGMIVMSDKLSKILLTLDAISYNKHDLSNDISILMEKYEADVDDYGFLLKESDFKYALDKMNNA